MALSVSPLNPKHEETTELQAELTEIADDYTDKVTDADGEDEQKELLAEFTDIASDYTKRIVQNSLAETIISITCVILYFAVFAYFMEGQTIGKRLVKIRTVNKDGTRSSFARLLVRSIFLFELPFKILPIILVYTCDVLTFYSINLAVYYLTYVYEFILIALMLGREDKRGLHDLIAGTKVEMISQSAIEQE